MQKVNKYNVAIFETYLSHFLRCRCILYYVMHLYKTKYRTTIVIASPQNKITLYCVIKEIFNDVIRNTH